MLTVKEFTDTWGERRRNAKLSQQQMAALANMHLQTVSRIERGYNAPTADNFVAVEVVLAEHGQPHFLVKQSVHKK